MEEQYLQNLKLNLTLENNWNQVILSKEWISTIPSKAGVYVFRHNNELVYVGETGNLKGRMKDLLDSRHHTLRRTIGKRLFSQEKGFFQATIKQKFPEHIEELVNRHISTSFQLAYLPISLGRKELEELIEREIKVDLKLNKRGQRKA